MERISGRGQFLKTVSISCPRQRSMMERQQKWHVHTLPGYQNHRIIFYREFAKTKGAGNSFTLNPGDIVVKDACMEEITGKMPNTASELLARQKPEAFQITAFSDNTSHLRGKHYRVGG